MRRFTLLFLILVLIAAACGDDDGGAEPVPTSPPPTDAPQATAAPAPDVTSAPQATDPPATNPPATTAAPVATAAPEDSARALRIAAATLLAGEWSGEWVNTTFGSTGPIEVTVTVDAEVGFLLANTDVGGNVFGQSDPEPRIFELDLVTGPPYSRRSGLLGEFSLDIGEDGSFVLVADDVSAEGIATMSISGTLGPSSFSATYTIEFDGGGGAEGTIEVAKTS
jgi:hypothetical protein